MTTAVTSSSGTISSTGIGSGLDVSSIITQLMAAESQPLTLLQTAASSINTQISAVGQIHSLSSTLGDKSQALESLTLWKGVSASSSDSSVVTADTSAGGATAGTYAVSVQSLAAAQTVTSGVLDPTGSTLGSGTLKIELGSWSTATPPVFSGQSGSSAISVTINPGETSLSAIRDKINGANAGVQATIITDATGSRLSLRSTTTGATNGFRITATEDGDPDLDPAKGLSALSFDEADPDSQLQLNQPAANAKATINGIPIESTTNTLANVSDGLSITVNKVSASPVSITLSKDTTSMTNAINGFVSAYNALNTYIHSQTKYDATSKTGGPLQGDPSIIGFQGQLRSIATGESTASSVYSRLSDIGITLQADGSLAADSTKLSKALAANPGEVQKLFAGTADGTGADGLAHRMQVTLDAALATGGRLASEEEGLRGRLSRNSDSQDEMQTRLDATQKRYQAQFQALDTNMAKLTALSTYMTQQITLMNNSSSA